MEGIVLFNSNNIMTSSMLGMANIEYVLTEVGSFAVELKYLKRLQVLLRPTGINNYLCLTENRHAHAIHGDYHADVGFIPTNNEIISECLQKLEKKYSSISEERRKE